MNHLSAGIRFTLFLLIVSPGCQSPLSDSEAPAVESYRHTRPAWSPDGHWIAFTMVGADAGIYVLDTTGANLRRVVEGEGIGVSWSPDSRWLAFSRAQSLYKVKADGDSLTRLNVSAGSIRPAWSQDGERLVFVRVDSFTGGGLWLYEFRDGNTDQLLPYGNFPSWRPGGKELLFLDTRFDASTGLYVTRFSTINVMSLEVHEVMQLNTRADCGFSSFNPNGTAIIYSVKPFDDRAQVWQYEAGVSHQTQLTVDGGDHPAWSPDGTRIIFTRTHDGDGGLWIMEADGSGKRRLTSP